MSALNIMQNAPAQDAVLQREEHLQASSQPQAPDDTAIAATEPNALEVAGLSKIYFSADGLSGGVHESSFSLPAGTFFTLLGPSGCGKTTTLRCIAGLETPNRGRITMAGRTLFDGDGQVNVPLNRRNLGMVFQSYAIWPHMSVFENVAFPLRVSKVRSYSSSEIRTLVGEALETINLAGYENRSATQLSGGQQQRVALARAIVHKPRLLLLDEPLSNLDAALREEMRAELKRLQRQLGVTTIYVTHDQTEALEMSDTIAVMNLGQIVQLGSPRDIYFRPSDRFVASFVGSTNMMPGIVQGRAVAEGTAAVRLGDGSIVQCLFAQDANAGDEIMISLRPEAVNVVASGAPSSAGINRLAGTIETVSFLGNINRYRISAGGQTIYANTAPEHHLAPGATISLDFPIASALALR